MKLRIMLIAYFIAFLSQSALINLVRLWGFTPNLILCLTLAFTLLYDEEYRAIGCGVVFGVLQDVVTMQFAGPGGMAVLAAGLTAVFLRESLNKENILSAIILSAAGTFACNLTLFLLHICFGSEYKFLYWLGLQPFYMLYNCLVILIIYHVLIKKVVKHRNDRGLVWKNF